MGPHLIYHLGGGPGGIAGIWPSPDRHQGGHAARPGHWTTFPADTADILAAGVEAEARAGYLAELEAERDEALAAVLLASAGGRYESCGWRSPDQRLILDKRSSAGPRRRSWSRSR